MRRKRDRRDDEPRVLLGARIPADLHKRLKHFAVDHHLNLREVMEMALQEYIKAETTNKKRQG